jgi:hypothetical protein
MGGFLKSYSGLLFGAEVFGALNVIGAHGSSKINLLVRKAAVASLDT